jgi:HAD superfamily hydrolase (TIGR01549 family)
VLKAIFFDLDDTLLGNSMAIFIPAYFQALTRYVAHLIPAERLIAELMRATHTMDANDGSGPTNEEVFAAAFYPAIGYDQHELEPIFEQFYLEEFPKLQSLTQTLSEARPLVEWAFEHDLQVVIATNPLFPRLAVEQRLEWAGVPVSEFDYALVTVYDNMHATKSHPAYYREILAHVGHQPDECLMVGDDWKGDIVQATRIGIPTYWIARPGARPPTDGATPLGQGTLADLWRCVESGNLPL